MLLNTRCIKCHSNSILTLTPSSEDSHPIHYTVTRFIQSEGGSRKPFLMTYAYLYRYSTIAILLYRVLYFGIIKLIDLMTLFFRIL